MFSTLQHNTFNRSNLYILLMYLILTVLQMEKISMQYTFEPVNKYHPSLLYMEKKKREEKLKVEFINLFLFDLRDNFLQQGDSNKKIVNS